MYTLKEKYTDEKHEYYNIIFWYWYEILFYDVTRYNKDVGLCQEDSIVDLNIWRTKEQFSAVQLYTQSRLTKTNE